MSDFFKFLTEHLWTLLFTIVGAVSGIIGIVDFLKKRPFFSVKRKWISAVCFVVFLVSIFYLSEQYLLFRREGITVGEGNNFSAETYSQQNDGAAAGHDAEKGDTMENSVKVWGSGVAITGDGNNVTINNSPTSSAGLVTITKVSLNKTELQLCSGESAALAATVLYSDNSMDDQVLWVSNDETVIKVDAEGNITALSEGTAAVTAQASRNNTAESAVCIITVCDPPSGYHISLSSNEAALLETFYVYVAPYGDDITQIEVCAKSPSGEIFRRPLSDGAFIIYTETGDWTIYASLKNDAGVYEAEKEEDFVTIKITDAMKQFENIFPYE